MTISDAKEYKARLEMEITDLLLEFEKETELIVNEIYIKRINIGNMENLHKSIITTDVSISF